MARDQSLLDRLAAGLGQFSEDVTGKPSGVLARQRAEQELQQRQQLGNILAGQSIPQFLRPGGAEALSPEELQRTQLEQLSALGTPGALEIVRQQAPLTQKPQAPLSTVGKIQADINAGRISPQAGRAAIQRQTQPRAPLVQISSGEKAKTRTSRDQLTEGLTAVNELIAKIEEDPTRAGILGFGRGVAETAGGVVSDVASFIPGFEGVQKTVEGLQPKLGESIRGLRPLQNKLASGLARSRFGESGRIPVQQLELARKDVNIAEATSGRQTLDSLRQVRKELQSSLDALIGRAGEAGFALPVKKSPVIKLDENFNIIQ